MTAREFRARFVAGGIVLVLLAATAACAETKWPTALDYSVGVSTNDDSRLQLWAAVSGPIAPDMSAKVGGWWITASDDNRAFVGDAYIDYSHFPLYAAVGRKYVPFGPAGLLVSPGVYGGELQLRWERITFQAIAGTLAFTPVTGGTRFTYAGNRTPSEESIRAGRVAVDLTEPGAAVPVRLAVNVVGVMHDTGSSLDLSIEPNEWLTLFAEAADFDDVNADVYGIRFSDQRLRPDATRHVIVVVYYRDVPVGFIPAVIGASAYFEDQTGLAGGIYYQLNQRQGLGLYADENDAILTLFTHVPL